MSMEDHRPQRSRSLQTQPLQSGNPANTSTSALPRTYRSRNLGSHPQLHDNTSTSNMSTVQGFQPTPAYFPTNPSDARTIYNPYPLAPTSAPYRSADQLAFPALSSGDAFLHNYQAPTAGRSRGHMSSRRQGNEVNLPSASLGPPGFNFLPTSGTASSTFSASSSPLTGRTPNLNLSSSFIFDPDWELPSPMTSQNHVNNSSTQISTRRNGKRHANPPQAMYPPSSTSTYMPQSLPISSNNSMQGQANPTAVQLEPCLSTPAPFRYTGYSANGLAQPSSGDAFSTGLVRSSSLSFEPRNTASPLRPSSEPLTIDPSRFLSMPPVPPSHHPSTSVQPSPVFAYTASPSSASAQAGNLYYPYPYTNNDPSLLSAPNGRSFSSQSTPGSGYGANTHGSLTAQVYPDPCTRGSSSSGSDQPQPQPSYSTRTRLNMQGLIHQDHVEQGFPGEWGGAFR